MNEDEEVRDIRRERRGVIRMRAIFVKKLRCSHCRSSLVAFHG